MPLLPQIAFAKMLEVIDAFLSISPASVVVRPAHS